MAVVRTLIRIRERSAFDLMDLALVLVRNRPGPILAASLAGCLPFALLNLWLTTENPEFPGYAYYVLLAMEMPWATIPLTIVLGGMMFGERPSAWKVAKTTLRSLVPLLFFQVFLRGIIILSVVLIPILPSRMAFLNEVILLERGRWRRVVDRSGVLCGDQGGQFFVLAIAQVFFGVLFIAGFFVTWQAFRMVAIFGTDWEEVEGWSPYIPSVQVAFWIAVSFFAIVRFLTYIDQRIRLEGWEVELRLRHVGAAMDEEERW